MNSSFFSCLSFAVLSLSTASAEQVSPPLNIIPIPLEVTVTQGDPFVLTARSSISAQGQGAQAIADFFTAKLQLSTGFSLQKQDKNADISLYIDATADIPDEGYQLSVSCMGVRVVAKDAAGLFYGMQSFLQLFPAQIASLQPVTGLIWEAQAVEISDAPRFAYRGIMLDVCRHFMPVDYIKRQIDVLSLFKMNRLHWHLTEDQAWRIEIKKYPKLTEIGAQRVEGEGHVHQGFYTQEEVKDIVAYAAARHITIVPEFELPGHELAAIAAYPELSCRNSKVTPRIVWGVEDIVMCPAKDFTFEFIEDVIDEMVPLFPGEYFHVGGDECPKESWKNCPACQALIKEKGLEAKDGHSAEENLQSYVIGRAEKMLEARGKKLIGWDEILEGGLSPNATVMSWRGEAGGIAAAKLGHDVVMTPNSHLYLDHFQGNQHIEPVAIGGHTTLARSYSYDPMPAELKKAGKEEHILGVQGNLWSEYLYSEQLAEYRLYPRAIAIAEVGWSEPSKKNFSDFVRRLDYASQLMDAYGIHYHIPQPEEEMPTDQLVFVDKATLSFDSSRPMKIVYTTDGSDPTPDSPVVTGSLTFEKDTTLKVRSVLNSGKMSPVRCIDIHKQDYIPASTPANTKAGLRMTTTKGYYLNMQQLEASKEQPEKRIMTETRELPALGEKASAIAEGYLAIPEDGVYLFRTNNNQLYIDGQLIVDNDGEVKRFSRQSGTIALAKGLHRIKIVYLGHILGGWPTSWDSGEVTFQHMGSKKTEKVTPQILFH